MLKLERITYDATRWTEILGRYPGHTLQQTPEWLAFVQETQDGEVVLAEVREGTQCVGHFVGLLVRRFGLRLLGSPLPGWTTSYMGFCLDSAVSRSEALNALHRFAFNELGCVHLEVMDRGVTPGEVDVSHSAFRRYMSYEVDLTRDEATLFANMTSACRGCIRKALRSSVRIEDATTDPGFAAEYYAQLRDVFAKQRLSPSYGFERVQALIRYLQPTSNLLCLRAIDADGRSIATGIFPAANGRAYFWGAASWRRHQILRPNELLLWSAMLHWKARGMRTFDMGGAGDYKRKYGPAEITVPWVRTSRYPILPLLRGAAANAVRVRQRFNALIDAAIPALHTASK